METTETRHDIPVNIEDIMHTAYLQYSLSVNVGRAIPDVRDGLKPGNRRILFAMHKLGLTKGHAYTKSAKVVGEVIGNYHPHGDASVYDTMVRMAQDFAMRSPLIDGQGNFGSIDGDPAAAYRYTECRMERLAEELLADIEKNTVEMAPTFDEINQEPTVLPARFPNLLVNGTTGIGVGMATNIPPHNLGEVIDATICLLENPQATTVELMRLLPGPDFPTGGIVCGLGEIRNLYETGRGVLKIRARAEIIEKDGREQIIVTEIPYAVNKEQLVRKIADLVNEKKLVGIAGLRDETSRRVGIRIVIDVKKNAMASVVLNQLFAHTTLENTFGCIMLVVDHQRPRVMNLRQLLQAYLDHRLEVVTRRLRFELSKAEERAHILAGLLIAVRNIDDVVKVIRASRTRELAAAELIRRFELSDRQAAAILDMRLHQLTGLAIEVLEKEHHELLARIAAIQDLLAHREKRLAIIRDELLDIKQKYADPRRTELAVDEGDLNIADLIARHSCVITVSNTGYIKRVPVDTYRTQARGGKGIMGMETKDEDHVEHLFNADSHDLIFFFTDRGLMHWLNVYEIPEGTRIGRGKAIVNLVKAEPGELIRAMLTLSQDDIAEDAKTQNDNPDATGRYILMATRRGVAKKTRLAEFQHLRRKGLKAINIDEGDDLIGAELTDGNSEILLSSQMGMACCFDETELRPIGRTARGVTGIRFKLDDDQVVSLEVFPKETQTNSDEEAEALGGAQLLVVTSGGMGKRSFLSGYRRTHRGARGVKNIKLKDGESVVGTIQIHTGDELLLTTVKGQMVRTRADEIRTVGRHSQGVRIIKINTKDRVTGISRIIEVESTAEDDDATAENHADDTAATTE